MSREITYSVTVPVFNSMDALTELCERTIATLDGQSFEIILVDDGSRDNSWQVINGLKQRYPSIIRAIRLQRNHGQHAATLCAFNFAEGKFIITIDDDLQYAPEDILQLIAKQQETEADVVYAIRTDKQQSVLRKVSSYTIDQVNKVVEQSEVKGSSFRLITRRVIDEITTNHRNNFIFIDEVVLWYTTRFAYVSVVHHERKFGKTGYNFFGLLKLYVNIVVNYSAFWLKAMIYIGFVFSLFFLIIGVVFIYRKAAHDVPIGWTSTIVAIFFSTSIIMLCLGILGLYFFKIFQAQQNKPLYTIKQVL